MKKFKKITFKNYDDVVHSIEEMGDDPNFENDEILQKESDRLELLISKFDKKHYYIGTASSKEIEKLKKAYREEGGKL